MKYPVRNLVEDAIHPAAFCILSLFGMGCRQEAEYSRNQYQRYKEKGHNIQSGNQSELFQDHTVCKGKYTKTDSCSKVGKQGYNTHLTYHIAQGRDLITTYIIFSMVFIQEVDTVRYPDHHNQWWNNPCKDRYFISENG
ncbi:hypothetical protein D3C86_1289050 [compost metagenome]